MDGVCFLCSKTLSKSGMTRHLKTHLKEGGNERLLHILVDGLHNPEYWLHIEIPADARLKDLDEFLRDIWLECCGHLSAFEIHGEKYVSETFDDFDEEWYENDMSVPLEEVMELGTEFIYIYDFGSSTELRLRVMSERKGKKEKEKVRVLARNNPPSFWCGCGNEARWVCPICMEENVGRDCYLCHECGREHGCGEDILLPIVNSPRCGVCGYEGGELTEQM